MTEPIPVAVCPGLPITVDGYKFSVPGSADGVRNVPPWDGQILRRVVTGQAPAQVQVLGYETDEFETATWGVGEYTTQLAGGLSVLRIAP